MSSAVAAPLSPGTVLGPYRIANVPGGGAVGEAVHSGTNERVAVKRLPESITSDTRLVEEYRRYIGAVQELRDPGILRVRSIEVANGAAIVAMDFAPRG